jgi:hypothetical protein
MPQLSPLGVDTTGWNETMISLYSALQNQLEMMIQQGQMIDPSIEITPELTAGFLEQAQTELDPYYDQTIELARRDLTFRADYYQEQSRLSQQAASASRSASMRSAGISRSQATEQAEITRQERQRVLPEQMAERGLAFSGQRIQTEQRIDDEASRQKRYAQQRYSSAAAAASAAASASSQRASSQLRYQLTGMGMQAEAQFGSETVGEWGLPFYRLSGGITGQLERERATAEQQRASQLESAYRSQRATDFYQQT